MQHGKLVIEYALLGSNCQVVHCHHDLAAYLHHLHENGTCVYENIGLCQAYRITQPSNFACVCDLVILWWQLFQPFVYQIFRGT